MRRSLARSPGGVPVAPSGPVQSCPKRSGRAAASSPATRSIASASQSVNPGPPEPTAVPRQMPKRFPGTSTVSLRHRRRARATATPRSTTTAPQTMSSHPGQASSSTPTTASATPGAAPSRLASGNALSSALTTGTTFDAACRQRPAGRDARGRSRPASAEAAGASAAEAGTAPPACPRRARRGAVRKRSKPPGAPVLGSGAKSGADRSGRGAADAPDAVALADGVQRRRVQHAGGDATLHHHVALGLGRGAATTAPASFTIASPLSRRQRRPERAITPATLRLPSSPDVGYDFNGRDLPILRSIRRPPPHQPPSEARSTPTTSRQPHGRM